MKIIEQARFVHRRSRRICDGSDGNAAAWMAMNASREFPPHSQCQYLSARSPVPVRCNRVLAGTDHMKKLRSDTAAGGTGRPPTRPR